MAFGDDPANERFLSEYFEEKDGQFFLRPPKGAQALMPISYELYLELVDAHEREGRIAKTLVIMCLMAGWLYGAYRWIVSDDLLQILVFTGIGILAAMIGAFAVAMHGAKRLAGIYIGWAKASANPKASRAELDHLF